MGKLQRGQLGPASEASALEEILPFEASIGYQIRATHRQIQSYLQTKIEPYGVTLGMWYFLRVLWNADGLTQRELSQRVGTMEPTTLIALRSMQRAGFVFRKRNKKDGRKVNIFLTSKGRALQSELLPLARQVVDDAAAGLADDERKMLLKLLAAIQKNIAVKRSGDIEAAGSDG